MSTATELRAEAAEHDHEAHESFERCDTDGFLTQWAHGLTAQEKRLQADIEENGGLSDFPALFDLEGNYVPAKLINGRYGTCWALTDDEGTFLGEFITAFPARRATIVRKGYTEGSVLRPARACITGGGQGLAGAASCYVSTYTTDGPEVAPTEILYTDRFEVEED
jgi:hypothetical protein